MFSPDDFKQWLQQQGSFSAAIPRANLMGLSVYSATPKRKLAPHMCIEGENRPSNEEHHRWMKTHAS